MLLEFDKTKEKNVVMMVEATGVDGDNLDIVFNIHVNGVRYGFPCKLQENKVLIDIPALENVINELKVGKYKATLDIVSSDKYFMRPFNEKIEIINIPDMKIDKGSLEEDKLSIIVSELIEDGKEVKKTKKVIENKTIDKKKTDYKGLNDLFKEDVKTPVKKLIDTLLD